MAHPTANLRRFLVDTFSDEELKTFCFDYFRDVFDLFATGMTKTHMIQLLMERCVRREALPNLEAALAAERPDQYAKRFGAPESAAIPAETAPAGRDPRQVFISHAHQDAEFAHRLAGDLRSAGWRAWIAPDSIGPGEKWVEAIGRGLDGSGVFLVVLTPAAVASRMVKTETNAAIGLENRDEVQFIPLEVVACTAPVLWNVYQRVPFRGRYEDGLRELLGRLGTVTGEGEASRQVGGETRRQGDKETKQEAPEQKLRVSEPSRIEVAAAALRLSGPQVQELMASLLDAYDENSLRQMVRFQLDEHLDLIAGGGNLSQVVFNLIAWAERKGRVAELVAKAHAFNPGNARLAAFARSLPGVAIVEPATPARDRWPVALIQNHYPVEYRAEIVQPLTAAVRRGESVCLVGLAGVGKSYLVHFLEQPEVTKHYLPDYLSDRTHFISVSCRPGGQPKEEIFEALLTSVWLVARRRGYDLAEIAPSGIAKYQVLRNVLRDFCGAHEQRLVFVLDEFENLIQQQPEDFFDDLRALRDDHRASGQLTFVTITHRMPQLVPGRTIFSQTKFFALLRDHIYPLPPYRFADADDMLSVLLQKTEGLEIVPEDRQRLIAVSGGHSGLLRAVFSVVPPNFGISVPKLLRLSNSSERVREVCNQIWIRLHRDERQALSSLAQNQAISPQLTAFLQRRGLLREGASPAFFSPLFGEYVSSIQSKPESL